VAGSSKLFNEPPCSIKIWTFLDVLGDKRKVYKVLMGNPEVKRPVGRPRHIWEHGIGICLSEIVWWSVDLVHVAEDRDW
jgi:hypothetical protein